MLKTGLNIARFKQHISLIEKETLEYFARWGNAGERGISCKHLTLHFWIIQKQNEVFIL